MSLEVPKSTRKTLEDICTPIFDIAMGKRLRIIREKHLWDQSELGERLGLAQKQISELENGRLAVPRFAFTVTKLKEHFWPDEANFILFGTNSARFNEHLIHTKYFDTKFRKERKPLAKREHWTHRACREGYPRRQS